MSCIINIKAPEKSKGTLLSIDTKLSREDLPNGGNLQVVALMLGDTDYVSKETLDKFKDNLHDLLQDLNIAYITADEYSKEDALIPNYTKEELMAEYPDLEWGDVPNEILIVDDNRGIRNINLLTAKRVLVAGKTNPIYVVPRNNVAGFAYHTKLLSIIEKLRKGDTSVQLPERFNEIESLLRENTNDLKARELEREIKEIGEKNVRDLRLTKLLLQTTKESNTLHVDEDAPITELSKKISNLIGKSIANKESKLELLRKNVEEAKKNAENNPDSKRLAKQVETAQRAYDNMLAEIDLLKAVKQRLDDRIAEELKKVEELLDAYEKDPTKLPDLDGTIASKKDEISKIRGNTKAPWEGINDEHFSVPKFLEHFMQHQSEWANYLSKDNFYTFSNICTELLGWNSYSNSDDLTVVTVDSIISKYRKLDNLYEVPIKEISQYFKEIGLSDTLALKEKLIKLLFANYISRGNAFSLNLDLSTDKTLVFKRRYGTMADIVDWGMDTESMYEHVDTIDGFLVYRVKTKDGEVYFFNSEPINQYTRKLVGYSSMNEVESLIKERSPKQKLFYNNMFMSDVFWDEDFKEVYHTSKRSFYPGQLIRGLDYKKGPVKIPMTLTRNLFWEWVDDTFVKTDADFIKANLNDREELALFYSHFGNISTANGTNKLRGDYKKKMNDLNFHKIVTEIAQAPEIIYEVSKTTVLHTHLSSTEFVILLTVDRTNKGSVKSQNASLSSYVAMQEVFAQLGVPIELLNEEEMRAKSGEKGVAGWHEGGVIYLNTSIQFRPKTAFHELSHLLLALVKANNPETYEKLLRQFETIGGASVMENKKKLRDYYAKQMKGLSEQEKDLYILEEAFAEYYGVYIERNKGKEYDIVFGEFEQEVSKNSIFDKTTNGEGLTRLINSVQTSGRPAKDLVSFWESFSSLIKEARKRVGFGFNLDSGSNLYYQEFIDNNISLNTDNGIVENCE